MTTLKTSWDTGDECNFLLKLGKHSEKGGNRFDLLNKYIQAAEKRTYWGNLNRQAVLAFAIRQLGMA